MKSLLLVLVNLCWAAGAFNVAVWLDNGNAGVAFFCFGSGISALTVFCIVSR